MGTPFATEDRRLTYSIFQGRAFESAQQLLDGLDEIAEKTGALGRSDRSQLDYQPTRNHVFALRWKKAVANQGDSRCNGLATWFRLSNNNYETYKKFEAEIKTDAGVIKKQGILNRRE